MKACLLESYSYGGQLRNDVLLLAKNWLMLPNL